MTTSDKKKTQVLAGLLMIAGFTWFFIYRTPGPDNSQPKNKSRSKIEKRIKDPRIQIGLIETASRDGGGQKNIFQYRQEPSRPKAEMIRTNSESTVTSTTRVIDPPPMPSPREPASKTFKYEGFSIKGAPADGRMVASLSDGGNSYTVTLGECLLGQYCVRQLTENMIEIEDLQLKQRQTFSRTFQ
jgi:hypothetical protein